MKILTRWLRLTRLLLITDGNSQLDFNFKDKFKFNFFEVIFAKTSRKISYKKGESLNLWQDKFHWILRVISELWLTSMPEKLLPLNVSYSIPVLTIKSARLTMVPPRWTGWLRSRKEVSLLLLLRLRASGKNTALTSSIPLATSTLPSKLSVLCASSMVQLRCFALREALNLNLRRFGVRPISMAFREWFTSIRWTSWVPTSITS